MEPSDLKSPPHSHEAEQSVIGGLMLDQRGWDEVADVLSAEDFYREAHRIIFDAIRVLHETGGACDVVTVAERLEQTGKLDRIGGLAYLGSIVEITPSAANIKSYATIVRERSVVRQLIQAGAQITESGFDPRGRAVRELVDEAERLVFAIAEMGAGRGSGFLPIQTLAGKALERIDALYRSGSGITGLATGFRDFDEMTSGLQDSDLVVVAGRPSMGKTAFAMNIAENCAIQLQQPVAIFSMEMPAEQLAMRMIASLGRVDTHRVRVGQLSDEDWPRITSTVSLLNEAKLFIDDTPALTPTELRARTRRLKRQHGLALVIVDYLQLMQVPGSSESRVTEISEISRSLKALAKELSVPVVALSQLNRALEQRPDKRPKMADLRESGAIEQDADLIVFIYRDEVYNEDSPDQGSAEIILAKQRNGPTGMVRLAFRNMFTRFEDFTRANYP